MSLQRYRYGRYPGDSISKAAVRHELYTKSAKAWVKTGRPGGAAVVLAGPQAMELTYLRDYLQWDPKKTWFVDTDATGLGLVQSMWPKARTYNGYLHEALKEIGPVGFLNLDFMGLFNKYVEKSLHAARGKILSNAVVSYTFYRCREHPTHHSYHRILDSARDVLSPSDLRDKGIVRWVGPAIRLQDLLGIRRVEPILLTSYRSTSSAMGVIALQSLVD